MCPSDAVGTRQGRYVVCPLCGASFHLAYVRGDNWLPFHLRGERA